jgi:hypothetical protein
LSERFGRPGGRFPALKHKRQRAALGELPFDAAVAEFAGEAAADCWNVERDAAACDRG